MHWHLSKAQISGPRTTTHLLLREQLEHAAHGQLRVRLYVAHVCLHHLQAVLRDEVTH